MEVLNKNPLDYTPSLKPGEVSTGTTIMAIPFEGGVVLGADSRVSTGTYVANRVSDKIAQLSDHIFCCRSGSAADTQALTDYVKYYLSQLAVETGRPPLVKVAAHMMRKMCYDNKDSLMAGVIIGGWDPVNGGQVYNIPLGGSMIAMPFALGGSGSTFIYGLVDSDFKENMSKDEARTLVKKALAHAMARDGSSGGIIRTVVVTAEGNDRDYTPGNRLPYGPAGW
mmetsp:Transcript_14401/g.20723  ORF Transcript_14401/g.20723 Transcript_14401/m.20723 type:complete len:225 (+) Transcript_14401:81-755(+)|eukprot:CAMPEP_0202453322 /NCGR_PEP_ID=MMETSP1360-20130828/11319_1 /ASSEMBLY_ACC=CAM_ASM_000848 /TAXON_ID=515479 /ORGANISM="Licmophora paradoxa, Strain CCMP2313" /LENGTH=224 /DNA_ID=CAMNT_0049072387 /DNA_START=81 /DNA_END=755 /DNA_ORIENTATION=-